MPSGRSEGYGVLLVGRSDGYCPSDPPASSALHTSDLPAGSAPHPSDPPDGDTPHPSDPPDGGAPHPSDPPAGRSRTRPIRRPAAFRTRPIVSVRSADRRRPCRGDAAARQHQPAGMQHQLMDREGRHGGAAARRCGAAGVARARCCGAVACNGNKSTERGDGTPSNVLSSNRGLWCFCLPPPIFSLISSMFFIQCDPHLTSLDF